MQEHRIEKVRAEMRRLGLDALIVTEPSDRYYLTGWNNPDSQAGETAYWFIVDASNVTVISWESNRGEIGEAIPTARFAGVTGSEPRAVRAAAILVDLGCGRVGYDDLYLSSGDFRRLTENAAGTEWVPVVDIVRQIRAIKEPIEIEYLRRAIAITDDAYMSMREWIEPGATERGVARFIERYVKDHGAEDLAFSVLVGSGPNSANIHHHPTVRAIQPGDPCWIDFGAKIEGYCADMSRAFCLGSADDRLLALYDAILAAQTENIAALVVGSNGEEIARRSNAVLESRGYTVGHSGGHGIGLQVHELPWLDRGLPIPVEENVVVCADPGVYITGWGGMRIEENVLVTKAGPEVLSKSTQELIIPI